jgi:hypothetical protein
MAAAGPWTYGRRLASDHRVRCASARCEGLRGGLGAEVERTMQRCQAAEEIDSSFSEIFV